MSAKYEEDDEYKGFHKKFMFYLMFVVLHIKRFQFNLSRNKHARFEAIRASKMLLKTILNFPKRFAFNKLFAIIGIQEENNRILGLMKKLKTITC